MIKTINFDYTGTAQTWTVPVGIKRIYIKCYGAQGQNYGGLGGLASGYYDVKDIDSRTLNIYVGGRTGWNGGGVGVGTAGLRSGGGASDIRLNGTTLNHRLIVAGGGGGGWNYIGGAGGGLTGGKPVGGSGPVIYPNGGTQTNGGAGGYLNPGNYSGTPGGFGYGGNGGYYNAGTRGCGGGGGWYGGGGGAGDLEAGSGGSSYIALVQDGTTTAGVRSGNGLVTISYEEDLNAYFLIDEDGNKFIPQAKYFDSSLKVFNPVSFDDIKSEIIANNETLNLLNLNKPFVVNTITYTPSQIIDYSKYKIGVLSVNNINNLNPKYIPTNISLSKAKLKLKEFNPILSTISLNNAYVDVAATDKTNITYTLDYSSNSPATNTCDNLNLEIIEEDFYINFKLNDAESLLKSFGIYTIDKVSYKKIKNDDITIQKTIENSSITFKNAYSKILINRLRKQVFKYIDENLENF